MIAIKKNRTTFFLTILLVAVSYFLYREWNRSSAEKDYEAALQEDSIEVYETFLNSKRDMRYKKDIEYYRDKKAFELAQELNSFAAYQDFLDKYPNSAWRRKVTYHRDKAAHNHAKESKSLYQIVTFLRKNPDSAWVPNFRYLLRHNFGYNHESEVTEQAIQQYNEKLALHGELDSQKPDKQRTTQPEKIVTLERTSVSSDVLERLDENITRDKVLKSSEQGGNKSDGKVHSSSKNTTNIDQFLQIFSSYLSGEADQDIFLADILGQDIRSYPLVKKSDNEFSFTCSKKKQCKHLEGSILKSFLITSKSNQINAAKYLTINLDEGITITPAHIMSHLGMPSSVQENFTPRFYDDCTFGYYDEVIFTYNTKNILIRIYFNISDTVKSFYEQNQIQSLKDDPGYRKLRWYIKQFQNYKNAPVKSIRIKIDRRKPSKEKTAQPDKPLTPDRKSASPDISVSSEEPITWGNSLNPSKQIPKQGFAAYYFNTKDTNEAAYTETVEDIAINYAWDALRGIKSEDFGGYWVGNFTCESDGNKQISINQGHSKTRLLIDGKVLYEGGSDKELLYQCAAGTHTVEVEYTNNWHTTEFSLRITEPTTYLSLSEISETLQETWLQTADVGLVSVYESSTKDLSLQLEVKKSNNPLILFLTSYSPIVWVISNPYGVDIKAVVYRSYSPGTMVTGDTGEQTLLMATKEEIGTYSSRPFPECSCRAGHFHCEGKGIGPALNDIEELTQRSLSGFTMTYSAHQLSYPERTVDQEFLAKLVKEAEKRRTLQETCKEENSPDFNTMFKK